MISTHVLDTKRERRGRPQGRSLPRRRAAPEQETDEDGRIAELSPPALEPGVYRIVFHADSGFFEKIEVSIAIADPDEHFHVPLLVALLVRDLPRQLIGRRAR